MIVRESGREARIVGNELAGVREDRGENPMDIAAQDLRGNPGLLGDPRDEWHQMLPDQRFVPCRSVALVPRRPEMTKQKARRQSLVIEDHFHVLPVCRWVSLQQGEQGHERRQQYGEVLQRPVRCDRLRRFGTA